MAVWDTNRVKAQLRLTAQRLGQIQDKLDSSGQITRRDISILLQQGNNSLARAKAQKAVRDDIYGDLLQTLEMQIGVVLEHAGDLERSIPPSPVVVEAASSIIYAAPHVESKDLHIVRDILIQRLGPDFARSAAGNHDGYVSARVVQALSSQPPSAQALDSFLYSIAKAHGIQWQPDFDPQQKVDVISAMLDPASVPSIDMPHLRDLCSHGLPEYPPWLRPKVWRLLLGTLPPEKARWPADASKQRDSYYDLVRRLLQPFSELPPPETTPSLLDASLLNVSKELSHVPRALFISLEEEPEDTEQCPLSETAPDDIRISCAKALDDRLRQIRELDAKSGKTSPSEDRIPEVRLEGTPEIRLELPDDPSDADEEHSHIADDRSDNASEYLDAGSIGTPEISLSTPDSPTSTHSGVPTTLVPSRVYSALGAHPKHESALTRLLYIHFSLNPAHRAPQTASLLVPLYSALVEEVLPEDAAHTEADAFWLFETFVSEFSELDEAEGSEIWMKKFGERMSWADMELTEDLQAKGLDPALPHYSYRWLTTLLTHTLPLPAVLMTWDALFSCPSRDRQTNPRLDYLLDVCASLLVSARGHLFRLGKRPGMPLNLWGESTSAILSEPLTDRELEEAFIQGMAMLQTYPLENVGGMGRVLQLAHDLATQREKERQASAAATAAGGLGARLRNTVWRTSATVTTQATAPHITPTPAPTPAPPNAQTHDSDDSSDDSSDSESDDEAQTIEVPSNPNRSTLTTRLANTVWRGITNQSAMDAPPTPTTPSPLPSPRPEAQAEKAPTQPQPAVEPPTNTPTRTSIWGYAEKLKDSDAAATFAKVSTNWRVKALDAWSKRGNLVPPNTAPLGSSSLSPSWTPHTPDRRDSDDYDLKRSSLPLMDRSEVYSPPARPAFFHPPRDTVLFDPKKDPLPSLASPTGSDMSAHSEGDIDRSRRSTVASLTSRTPSPRSATSTRSGGPKPLLLGSHTVVSHARSPTLPATVIDHQFADAVRAKRPSVTHRTSQSSMSSLSPPDNAQGRVRTPDSGSRIVPIGRARSPMAIARDRRQESMSSAMSSATSSPVGTERRLPSDYSTESPGSQRRQGWKSADARNSVGSTASIPSPPPPSSPPEPADHDETRVVSSERQRGSVVLGEFGEMEGPIREHTPKVARRAHTSLSKLQIEESSDSSPIANLPARSSRVKSKRYPPRLANLRSRDAGRANTVPVSTSERDASSSALAVDWPDEGDATTPKASSFENDHTPSSKRVRKISNEGRARKVSADGTSTRTRKISTEGRDAKEKRVRDSAAVEGDDEGYDEFLSAYESEDSSALH